MNEFDKKAGNWDENPIHQQRADSIAAEIRKAVKLSPGMKGFEYGCGTGLLSFNLIRDLKSIVLADNSEGMLEVLKKKIVDQNITNMISLKIDLEKEAIPGDDYDLIFTQMALHHVIRLDSILGKFYTMLQRSGTLCIADLYTEDGSFHGKDFTGHKGFNPEDLKIRMEKVGFESVQYQKCFQMSRNVNGKDVIFPLFLITGRKK